MRAKSRGAGRRGWRRELETGKPPISARGGARSIMGAIIAGQYKTVVWKRFKISSEAADATQIQSIRAPTLLGDLGSVRSTSPMKASASRTRRPKALPAAMRAHPLCTRPHPNDLREGRNGLHTLDPKIFHHQELPTSRRVTGPTGRLCFPLARLLEIHPRLGLGNRLTSNCALHAPAWLNPCLLTRNRSHAPCLTLHKHAALPSNGGKQGIIRFGQRAQ